MKQKYIYALTGLSLVLFVAISLHLSTPPEISLDHGLASTKAPNTALERPSSHPKPDLENSDLDSSARSRDELFKARMKLRDEFYKRLEDNVQNALNYALSVVDVETRMFLLGLAAGSDSVPPALLCRALKSANLEAPQEAKILPLVFERTTISLSEAQSVLNEIEAGIARTVSVSTMFLNFGTRESIATLQEALKNLSFKGDGAIALSGLTEAFIRRNEPEFLLDAMNSPNSSTAILEAASKAYGIMLGSRNLSPELIRGIYENTPSGCADSVVNSLVTTLTSSKPREVAALISGDTRLRERFGKEMINSLAQKEPSYACSWALEFDSSQDLNLLRNATTIWLNQASEKASSWIRDMPQSPKRDVAIHELLTYLKDNNEQSSVDLWLKELNK